MNSKNRLLTKSGFAGPLLLMLTGCVTYQEASAPPPTAPPPPAVAYVPPPPPPPPAPDPTVMTIQSTTDFYEPLSSYGEWVVVGSYGRCWRPAHVEAGWRPYCNGYWQRTDAGWFWVSSEPWAWATYHYGRWDWNVSLGWIWVPQTQWAPSWVAWREGDGYIGWAPLPPTATIAVGGGVVYRDAAYAPSGFVFVHERNLCEPVRPTTVIVNNTTIINKTVNITRIQVVNQNIINEGPRPDVVERAGGRRVQTVAVRDLRHKEETPVIVQHPGLRRNGPPPHTTETTVTSVASPGPQPTKGILPHQSPPVVKQPDSTTVSQVPVVENRPPETIKGPDAPAKHPKVSNQAAAQPHADNSQPAHTEKAPKARTETERPPAVKHPAPIVTSDNMVSSNKAKPHGHDEPKNKGKEHKEKNGESSDSPQ